MNTLPEHIAIIMDGNGRWAKQQGFLTRIKGHERGVLALRAATTGAAELGIKYLTVYAFSSENWNRPKPEINALMRILVKSIKKELKTLNNNNIRLNAIGDLSALPKDCQDELQEVMHATAGNDHMVLTLALSYGSRQEITQAVQSLAQQVASGQLKPEDIDQAAIAGALYTADMPDPDLVIRTSGEQRVSNFLLWQISYAELVFLNVLWPDFSKEHLIQAIAQFQGRERRLGKTSEQLK